MDTPTEIAAAIIDQMSPEDRANFCPHAWFAGVSSMLVDAWEGADTEEVLEEIDDALVSNYSPKEDGEPCADCGEPVWHNSDGEDCWYHVDPAIICFLANGKAPPMGIVAVAS